jgi:catechol 2,3-dioxygenase-like lactoylglutathione lyase family enzyme
VLDHVTTGVKDVGRAKKFYDAALAPLGITAKYAEGGSLSYGDGTIFFWVNVARRPVPPDAESGLHFCFGAPSRESVDAFHAAALKAGGRDNGSPGLRSDYGLQYYAAFVVDPDGYRIEAYCDEEA